MSRLFSPIAVVALVVAVAGAGYVGLADAPGLHAEASEATVEAEGVVDSLSQDRPTGAADRENLLSDDQEVMCQSLVFLQGSGPGGPFLYAALLLLPFVYLARLRSGFRRAAASI